MNESPEPSIFTKIIRGEIPCHKVYEDEHTIAFLDIHPVMPGHVLVVPKNQVDHVSELPEADYSALFLTVKKVSTRLREVMQSKRAIILVMGYDIPHAHVHVMPSNSGEEFYTAVGRIKEAAAADSDHNALAQLAERLRF